MTRFQPLRKDEFISRKGKIIRKPKDDRCNRGHLLYYDSDREVWDCPICLKSMQDAEKGGKRACNVCGQVHENVPFTDCYSEAKDGPLPDDLGQAYRDKYGDHDDEDEKAAYRKAYHEEIDPYNGP